jgi:histidine ammonia-lyase
MRHSGAVETIAIGDDPLTVADVVAVAHGAAVTLAPAARERIRAGRAVVDAVLASGAAVYGVTTGVGHQKDDRLPDDELIAFQEFLIGSHATGVGDPAPTAVVRAAMFVRLAGLARGAAGASPAVADTLRDMLNAGVHPVVPLGGSVGAGDLGQMATIGAVALGAGNAELRGAVLPGVEALRRAGITPLRLAPKDGLALMSANGLSVGHGALVADRAARLAAAADVATALSLEAFRGNIDPLQPAVAAAKPFRGQAESARRQLAALDGGGLLAPGAARSVQDPLSFRVAAPVNGALREYVGVATRAVETELNAAGDNPLVDADSGRMLHNGNFHPVVLAIGFDALRVALAHVGLLSERRMSHLWNAFFASGPAAPTGGAGPAPAPDAGSGPAPAGPDGPPELFGLALRYPAAALVADLRHLAAPATLDVPPLDQDIEDHATGAPLAVRRADEALDLLAGLLAVELLLAADVVSVAGIRDLGAGTGAAYRLVREAVAGAADRSPASIHRAIRDAVVPAVV